MLCFYRTIHFKPYCLIAKISDPGGEAPLKGIIPKGVPADLQGPKILKSPNPGAVRTGTFTVISQLVFLYLEYNTSKVKSGCVDEIVKTGTPEKSRGALSFYLD